MSCTHPRQVYQHRFAKGKVLFQQKYASQPSLYKPLQIPCGQCIKCRLKHAHEWGMRCMFESTLHEQNSFITLTYNDENLPKNSNLERRDFQLFMKRLRKKFTGVTIRNFYCGEYGGKLGRPHFHAILFGLDFSDKVFHSKSKSGFPQYFSQVLSDTWGKGFCTIGDVVYRTCAYVAQYVLKKKTGEQSVTHYDYVDPVTFEVFKRTPEFSQPSLGKAIGKGWYELWKDDVFPSDTVIIDEKERKPPRLFLSLYELENPVAAQIIKDNRAQAALDAQSKELKSYIESDKRERDKRARHEHRSFVDMTPDQVIAEQDARDACKPKVLFNPDLFLQQRRAAKEKCVLAKLALKKR